MSSKYKKLPGIRGLHDFIVVRDPASGCSLMNVRQHCYEGRVKVAWRGDPNSSLVRLEGTYSSLGRLRTLSSTKMDNLKTMFTIFIPRERWLSCIST